MSVFDLVHAFETINERRRKNPESMTRKDWSRWRRYLLEIESLLQVEPVTLAGKVWEFIKVPKSIDAQIHSDHGIENHTVSLLGENGCFIPTKHPHKKGSALHLHLMPLKERYLISVPVRVGWTSPPVEYAEPGMALLFSKLTVEYQRIINRMIDRTVRRDVVDNRTSLRTETILPVRQTIENLQNIYQTANLSVGGMYIQSQNPPKTGQLIRIDLPISNGQRIICQAEVVHHVPYLGADTKYDGFGVRLLELNNHDKQKIRSHLAHSPQDNPSAAPILLQ